MPSDLVQVLPSDFATTFPEPMPDAIEAGILSDEDAEPENVKGLHDELTLQLLKVLTEQDEIADARRRGVDPRTRAKPTSRGGQERLRTLFETEPARLQRAWQGLMGSYEAAFGEEAANAFDKALRARHAGVTIVTQEQQPAAPNRWSDAISVSAPETNDAIASNEPVHVKTVRGGSDRRVIARLPVPRPLAHAVAAGHFGHDERGPGESKC